MSAIAFDTLKYSRRLMEAGVPKQQAEVQAEAMAEAFVFNVEALVTRDYLDARLGEQDARVEARFTSQNAYIEQRFAEQDARIEQRFAEFEASFERRFAALDVRLERELGAVHKQLHLHSWILALVAASTVVPAVSALLGY